MVNGFYRKMAKWVSCSSSFSNFEREKVELLPTKAKLPVHQCLEREILSIFEHTLEQLTSHIDKFQKKIMMNPNILPGGKISESQISKQIKNIKSFWHPENETSKYIFFFVQYFQSKIRAGFRIL